MSKKNETAPEATAQQEQAAATAAKGQEQEQIQGVAQEQQPGPEKGQGQDAEQAAPTKAEIQQALTEAAAALNKLCRICRANGTPIIFPIQVIGLFRFGDGQSAEPFQPQTIEDPAPRAIDPAPSTFIQKPASPKAKRVSADHGLGGHHSGVIDI